MQLSQIEAIDLDRIREEFGDGPDKYDEQAREYQEAVQEVISKEQIQ